MRSPWSPSYGAPAANFHCTEYPLSAPFNFPPFPAARSGKTSRLTTNVHADYLLLLPRLPCAPGLFHPVSLLFHSSFSYLPFNSLTFFHSCRDGALTGSPAPASHPSGLGELSRFLLVIPLYSPPPTNDDTALCSWPNQTAYIEPGVACNQTNPT